jgi:GLPGLI family protein
MKRTFLTLMILVTVLAAFSQAINNEGAVVYEEIIKFDIQLDNMTPEMEAMLPTESKTVTILYFTENVSRYEIIDNEGDAAIEEEAGGATVKIMISQPENIFYRDLKNKKTIEQTEFMTRKFLVESEAETDEWKLTGKQKMILDYPCQQAVKKDGEDEVVVWFTPAIPVSTGPASYANLPGLVLAMEADHGDRSIIASSVDLKKIDESNLQKPKKGKKVSKEKYMAIVKEKTEQMGEDGAVEGGQTVIMTISQ